MSSVVVILVLILCVAGLLGCLTLIGVAIWARRPRYRRNNGRFQPHRSEEARLG